MAPDLRDHLQSLANWHVGQAAKAMNSDEVKFAFHSAAATDIRASITACDDAERNTAIRDAARADRRFTGALPSAFGAFA